MKQLRINMETAVRQEIKNALAAGLIVDRSGAMLRIFRRFDDSGNGKMGLREFQALVKASVVAHTSLGTITKMFKHIDADSNGGIIFPEFEVRYTLFPPPLHTLVRTPSLPPAYFSCACTFTPPPRTCTFTLSPLFFPPQFWRFPRNLIALSV
jgi:hypothetical protein